MYRQCSTEEGALRQQQLTESLYDLMTVMPYARITIADICSRVGITRKTFYRYFDCKDDCLLALLDRVIQSFGSYYPHAYSTPRPNLEFLEHYFAYWQQQNVLLDLLCENQLTAYLYERTALCIRQEQLHRRAVANTDQEYDQMVFMLCGTIGIIISWHLYGYQRTPRQLAEAVSGLIGGA